MGASLWGFALLSGLNLFAEYLESLQRYMFYDESCLWRLRLDLASASKGTVYFSHGFEIWGSRTF